MGNVESPHLPRSVPVQPNGFTIQTGADAVAELPVTQRAWVIAGFEWSYDADPTDGRVRVVCNGQEYVNLDITTGGPGFEDYTPPERYPAKQAVQIILHNGGPGVTGKVRIKAHWLV